MEVAINYLAVVLSTVVAMIIGGLWYGPVFGSQWMRMMGFTKESVKSMKISGTTAMIIMVVLSLLTNYVLAHGIVMGSAYFGTYGVASGLMAAFWYWLGFCVPLTAAPFLWEGKTWKLWVFNAAYYLIVFLVAGAILGGWPA